MVQLPQQFNALSLPSVDQAIQQSEYNALRNEAQGQANDANQFNFDVAKKTRAAQAFSAIGRKGQEELQKNPNAWATLLPEVVKTFQDLGIPTDKIPPAGSSPEAVMEGLITMQRNGDMFLSTLPQDPVSKADLVGVQGEDGPVYTTAQDAIGKQPLGPKPTTAQLNYEYGLENPGFAMQATTGMPAQAQEYEYYLGLPNDEARAEYLRVKRGPKAPSSTLEKRLFDVNDAAFDSRAKSRQYEKLASDLLVVNPDSGLTAKWTEQIKAITGDEDAVTNLRKQWNNLRVGAAVQNLPPGVASDKDIELVMSAFLPEFANPETISSFMRGLSKIESLNADYHEFESDYLSRTGSAVGLGKAWRAELSAMGQPANDFQSQWDAAASGTVLEAPDGTLRKKP